MTARRSRRTEEPFLVVWSKENGCYLAYLPEWRTTIDGETVEEARQKARGLLSVLQKKPPDDGAGDRLIERLRVDGKGIDFRRADDSKKVARARVEIARAVTIATDPGVLAFLERRRKRPRSERGANPSRSRRARREG